MVLATEVLNAGQANAGSKAVRGEPRNIRVATYGPGVVVPGVAVTAACAKVADSENSRAKNDREFLRGLLFKKGRNYEHCII
jgi:hypothetical protein